METLEDYKESIREWVKMGFYSLDDILFKMSGLDIDETELRNFAEEVYNGHRLRPSQHLLSLRKIFDTLSEEGYITLHKAGYTSSDAYDTIDMVIDEISFKPYGYLLYNEQDLQRCFSNGELTLSFGAFRDTDKTQSSGKDKGETGAYFKSLLENEGFSIDWDGNPQTKIAIENFEWANSYNNEENWSYTRTVDFLNEKGNE